MKTKIFKLLLWYEESGDDFANILPIGRLNFCQNRWRMLEGLGCAEDIDQNEEIRWKNCDIFSELHLILLE